MDKKFAKNFQMAFFDNWRVQLASVNALTPHMQEHVDELERAYSIGSEVGKQMIFAEYEKSTANIQEQLQPRFTTTTYTMTTGMFFSMMWTKSVEMNPELAVIECNHTRHAILACSTKEAQDRVLHEYLVRAAVVKHGDSLR